MAESTAANGIGGLVRGAGMLAEGAGFLRRHPRLWALASVPVALATIATVSTAAAFWIQLDVIHAFFADALPALEPGAWWTWLWVGPGRVLFFLLAWLAVIVALAVALLASLLLANLLSAPFLDALSERVERLVAGQPPATGAGALGLAGEVLSSFVAELQRLAFLAGIWLALSLAGFLVPGAHLVTGPLLVAITILFLPLDYAGYALDRRSVSFAARRRWLRERLTTMAGFGGVAFVSCLVPGLNLIVTPSLVTAGTLLVLRTDPGGGSPPPVGRPPEAT